MAGRNQEVGMKIDRLSARIRRLRYNIHAVCKNVVKGKSIKPGVERKARNPRYAEWTCIVSKSDTMTRTSSMLNGSAWLLATRPTPQRLKACSILLLNTTRRRT